MAGHTKADPLYGKRKRKATENSNPLFTQWLTEWRDEAKEKGWKSEYNYSKALKSLQKFPLVLNSGKECSILQHFGDKICKMLDERLLKYRQQQELVQSAERVDISGHFPQSMNSSGSATHRQERQSSNSDSQVHEISDSSSDDDDKQPLVTYSKKTTFVGLAAGDDRVLQGGFDFERKVGVGGLSALPKVTQLPAKPPIPDIQPTKKCLLDVEEFNLPILSKPLQQCAKAMADADGTTRLIACNGVSSEQEEAGPNQKSKSSRQRGARQPREYVPAYRSGPYAVLLALFRAGRDPDFKGFMTKAELLRLAQPLADKSFTVPDPGSRYTAWSSTSTLVKKGFLTKENSPARYRLTEAGLALACRLEEVERRPGVLRQAGDVTSPSSAAGIAQLKSPPQSGEQSVSWSQLPLPINSLPAGNKVPTPQSGERSASWSQPPAPVYSLPVGNKLPTPQSGERSASWSHSPDPIYSLPAGSKVPTRQSGEQSVSWSQLPMPVYSLPAGSKVPTSNTSKESVLTSAVESLTSQCTSEESVLTSTGESLTWRCFRDLGSAEAADTTNTVISDDDDDVMEDEQLPDIDLLIPADRLNKIKSSAAQLGVGDETDCSVKRLRYWYVSDGEQLVRRKDQACVSLDEELGVGFLIKINYQHLLTSGCKYTLDGSRPFGEDFVYAYLSDMDCYEESQPPSVELTSPSSVSQHSGSMAVNSSGIASSGSGSMPLPPPRAQLVRPVHTISDSDSEPETAAVSASPDSVNSASSICRSADTRTEPQTARRTNVLSGSKTTLLMPSTTLLSLATSSVSDSQSSAHSTASSEATIDTVADFVLYPGTFDIILFVDNREFYGSNSSSKSLLPDLIKNGVSCELRLLSVGDLLWVARERLPPGVVPSLGQDPQGVGARRELVLNYVVERKRMDDLVSSMISGRLREQKFRLKRSGLQEKIILIESYGSMQHFSISEDRIKQAIANTEILDGFTIKQTKEAKETAAYLTLMTRYLQSYYQNKTLRSCCHETIRTLGMKFTVTDSEQLLMPFEHFNQISLKSKPLTVTELFAKHLLQVWGVSADKAKAILDRYPTPTSLFKAYATCSTDKERESLLATVKFGKNQRNLGIALSRQVCQLYNATTLT